MWLCVICGKRNEWSAPSREGMICDGCGLTWRNRAVVLAVLRSQGYVGVSLADFRGDYSIVGIGSSEVPALDARLTEKFWFTNSHYHTAPRLDLCAPDAQWKGLANFMICSEVLEHVPPPADVALAGLCEVLKDGGTAIITVPYTRGWDMAREHEVRHDLLVDTNETNETSEYYPDLVSYRLDGNVLTWFDSQGREFVDESPEFHGGAAPALTFRKWTIADLERRLLLSGFSTVKQMEFDPVFGVPSLPNGVVLLARK